MNFASITNVATTLKTGTVSGSTTQAGRSLGSALRLALGAFALVLVMHVGHGTAHAADSLFCQWFPALCAPSTSTCTTSTTATAVPELDPSAGASALALLLGGAAVLLGGRRRAL